MESLGGYSLVQVVYLLEQDAYRLFYFLHIGTAAAAYDFLLGLQCLSFAWRFVPDRNGESHAHVGIVRNLVVALPVTRPSCEWCESGSA